MQTQYLAKHVPFSPTGYACGWEQSFNLHSGFALNWNKSHNKRKKSPEILW